MRKVTLLAAALFMSTLSFSQYECDSIVERSVDEMTDKVGYKMKETLILNDYLSDDSTEIHLTLVRTVRGTVVLYGEVFGAESCIDRYPRVYFLFRDESKFKLTGNNDFNCNNDFHISFLNGFGNSAAISTMRKTQVKAIRIETVTGSVQKYLTPEQSVMLMRSINCMVELF